MSSPYFPYLVKNVVTAVDNTFSTRVTDPFNVFFDHGLYVEVAKNIYKKINAGIEDANIYPLIWLVTNSIVIESGKNSSLNGTVYFDAIIAMPTSNEYTQEQRDQISFIPRLLPIYDEFIRQLSLSDAFRTKGAKSIENRHSYRPYWGGGQGGVDNKNLFKNFIDAIQITGIKLDLKNTVTSCPPQLKTI